MCSYKDGNESRPQLRQMAGHWDYEFSKPSSIQTTTIGIVVHSRRKLVASPFSVRDSQHMNTPISIVTDHVSRYNSVVFEVTAGQVYQVSYINSSEIEFVPDAQSLRNMTWHEWTNVYDTQYNSDAGDSYLVIDNFGLDVVLSPNVTSHEWYYELPTNYNTSWVPSDPNKLTVSAGISLEGTADTLTYAFYGLQNTFPVLFEMEQYDPSSMPDIG